MMLDKRYSVTLFAIVVIMLTSRVIAKDGAQEGIIGHVYTRSDTDAKNTFELWRAGEKLKNVQNGVGIMRGDVVKPSAGKSVKVEFINTKCSDLLIDKETAILSCDVLDQKTGSLAKSISNAYTSLLKLVIERAEPPKEKTTLTLRGQNCECLPGAPQDLSPMPGEGSAILAGEKVIFCWSTLVCVEDAKIMITDGTGAVIYSGPFKLGKMNRIDANLRPGESYTWYVAVGEKEKSNEYVFRVLPEDTTKKVQTELKEIENKCVGIQNCTLQKALYLQMLSDAETDVDLYSASLTLLVDNNQFVGDDAKYKQYLLERIADHYSFNAGPHPLHGRL